MEVGPEYSMEGLMLQLRLQYFGNLMWSTDSLEKTLMLGKIEGRRRKGWQDEMFGQHHRLEGHESEQGPGVGDGQGGMACCSPWHRRVRHNWATELKWTELMAHTWIWIKFSQAKINFLDIRSNVYDGPWVEKELAFLMN